MNPDSQDDFEEELDDYSLGYRSYQRGEMPGSEVRLHPEWVRGWHDAQEDADDRERVRMLREGRSGHTL
jgi:hypothetical protein